MKRFAKAGLLLAAMAVMLTGCNCYKKMESNISAIKVTVNPQTLVLKGSNAVADITVSFPAKYFNKKAVIKITPVLVFDDGSGKATGTPKYLQGEKVKDNYTVVSYRNGGSYTQTVSFPYQKGMELSTLRLLVEASCKGGAAEYWTIGDVAVAQGVSMVQNSADMTSNLSIMPDNFRRVTTISQDADIMYAINNATVRPAELRSDQIQLLENFVKENTNKDRVALGNVASRGYASPDGPERLNDDLSRRRSESARSAMAGRLGSASIDAAAYGEDWDGFKELVEASNIRDKELILQVLQMYSSPVQRDQQIKNMSEVFEVLKKDILPQLRRTQLVASADVTGKTDAELVAALNNNVNSLSLEEMLFAATLVEDNAAKARAYKAAADKFGDVRAYNNYGVVQVLQGNLAEAKSAFNRAASVQSAPEISNNLGVVAMMEGNVAEARRYLSPLNTADARANKSLLALAEGDYATAVRDLSGYNLAVAQVCNGNLSQAKSALGNIRTAKADYLRAVIASREGDAAGAMANLKTAIAKDSSLRARAQKDIEFAKLFATSEFRAL